MRNREEKKIMALCLGLKKILEPLSEIRKTQSKKWCRERKVSSVWDVLSLKCKTIGDVSQASIKADMLLG